MTYQPLPERWSEGLAELTGHLVGDGDLTDAQTEWIYGGDDIDDGLAGLARGDAARADRRHLASGDGQRDRPAARRECSRPRASSGLGVTSAPAHTTSGFREPSSPRPTEVQAAFLRGLFGADGCVARTNRGKASRYVGLGSRSEALLKDVQRLLNGLRDPRSRSTRVSGARRPQVHLRREGRDHGRRTQSVRVSTCASPEPIWSTSPTRSASRRRASRRALESLIAEHGRYTTKPTVALTDREDRWSGARLQPDRAASPLLHRGWSRRRELLRVHARRRLGLQPRLAQPDEVPPRRRLLRHRGVRARGRRRFPRPGDRRRRRRATRPRRSAATRAPSARSGSATRTSARY